MNDVSSNPDLLMLAPTVSRVLAHVCCCMFHNSTEKVKSKACETNENPQRMPFSMMPCFSVYKHMFKHHSHFPQWMMSSYCLRVSNSFSIIKQNKLMTPDFNSSFDLGTKDSKATCLMSCLITKK